MDDASKLQRINNLARELMKHGQARSMEEAVHKATQQVESGSAMPAPEPPIFPAPEPAIEPEQPRVSEAIPEPPATPAQPAQPGQIPREVVMATLTDHTKKIEELNNKINRLIAELTELKEDIRKLKESPVTPPLKPKEAKQGQTQFKQAAPPQPAEEKKKEGHARTGNYKPDDVAIEKFFYYGSR